MSISTITTTEISSARYREIRDIAGMTLIHYTDGRLPVCPRSIIHKMDDCRLIKYSKFEREKLAAFDINAKDFFGSEDGCTMYLPSSSRYLIFYNDYVVFKNGGRHVWTLAHELGHKMLGHIESSGQPVMARTRLPAHGYEYLEQEADYFAAMLLAYPAVLKACGVKSAATIQDICGISRAAAQARYNSMLMSQMQHSPIDSLVESHFSRVIGVMTLPFQTVPDDTQFGW